MTKVSYFPEDLSVDLACKAAFEELCKKQAINIDEIDCSVLCTQNPEYSGLPHNSALIHSALGAKKDYAAFYVGLGCSGYVYSLSVITSFMNANGLKKGLLFTCDPYSRILDSSDKNTSLLFGDAATVTLISDFPVYIHDKSVFCTNGSAFQALVNDNGIFKMDGRAVFDFVMTEIPSQINDLIESKNLTSDDIDLFIFHQGSKFMIENLAKN